MWNWPHVDLRPGIENTKWLKVERNLPCQRHCFWQSLEFIVLVLLIRELKPRGVVFPQGIVIGVVKTLRYSWFCENHVVLPARTKSTSRVKRVHTIENHEISLDLRSEGCDVIVLEWMTCQLPNSYFSLYQLSEFWCPDNKWYRTSYRKLALLEILKNERIDRKLMCVCWIHNCTKNP